MNNFITNSGENNLKKRLVDLIRHSEELKFLVGFFYFSGISEFYDTLRNNSECTLKILVGLNVDKIAFKIVEYDEEEVTKSNKERRELFIDSVKKTINTDDFDTKEFNEQVKFFIEMIKIKRLIIRKTDRPNHSKLYIFKLNETQIGRKRLFITGSSNLTKAGVSTQDEFNVEISDYGVNDAEAYFDALWDEAVELTEHEETRQKLLRVVENDTHIKEVTPFEAFLFILKKYLESFEHKNVSMSLSDLLSLNGYTPYTYQLDAVKQALAVIEQNNGVILADVVGLGKTIIACSIAKELNKQGIIICPPGLKGDETAESGWEKYREEFKLYDWKVFSLGNMEKISRYLEKNKDIEAVIVDEAHRFRNQDTEDYESLLNICRGKNVILLTATPFNNRPGDILSLLKLFLVPKKSSITIENDLVSMFRYFKSDFERLADITKYHSSDIPSKRNKAKSNYKSLFGDDRIDLTKVKERTKYLSYQIRNIIEPVTIRRNRIDLQSNPYYKDEVKDLSKIDDPLKWFFELSKEQSVFYDRIMYEYFGDPDNGGRFKGPIYQPYAYETQYDEESIDEDSNFEILSQRNLYNFMRRMLVKRFESSFGSFKKSIENFRSISIKVLEFIYKTGKYILDRRLINDIYDKDIEDIEIRLAEYAETLENTVHPRSHRIYNVNDFRFKDKFIDDIESDIALYDEILKELNKLNLVENDPKSKKVITKLKEELAKPPLENEPKRKYIIFSEYVDTIKHLSPIFEKAFPGRCLIVPGKLTQKVIRTINANFDAMHGNPEDEYDILLTSDVISEGYNLNRAGMVINYDIPWNPVRVIQRVGRINRISKKVFESLQIVNFFPTEQGADLVQSENIARNKMFLIHNTLGEDSKIFNADEEPTAAELYKRIQQNPDAAETESFYTKVLKEFLEYKAKYPEIVEKLDSFPSRIKSAKNFTENEILVIFKKGRLYVQGRSIGEELPGEIKEYSLEEIYDRIKCKDDEKPLSLSPDFWVNYYEIKNYTKDLPANAPAKSMEYKALVNLKTLLGTENDEIVKELAFVRVLIRDISDFGTLSDYTLRRIAKISFENEKDMVYALNLLKDLRETLGKDYLAKIENRQELQKEVIIAVENQNSVQLSIN